MSANSKQISVPLADIEVVLVQFRLTNKEWEMSFLENYLPDGKGKKTGKTKPKQGKMFLYPTEKVLVFPNTKKLFQTYSLSDAFHENLSDDCHLLQFTFARGRAEISEEFKNAGVRCLYALNKLRENLWETRGYVNPCETPEQKMIAINCHRPVHTAKKTSLLSRETLALSVSDEEIFTF